MSRWRGGGGMKTVHINKEWTQQCGCGDEKDGSFLGSTGFGVG